jgi:hypothetical protein
MTNEVYASEVGAALDSDLLRGGGTDDTVALQRVLDRAKDGGPVHLVIDGPALVSGLDIYSHTTIEFIGGAGLFLKDGSTGAILRNAHRTRDEVVDEHIEIRGGFLNGNRKGQPRDLYPEEIAFRYVLEDDRTFRSALHFFGVNHLTIENTTLFNAHGFHSWVANAAFISIRNVIVDTGIPAFPERASLPEQNDWTTENWSNDDGLHFTGPIRYLTIDGAKIRTWDDAISICANDWGVPGGSDDITLNNEMGPLIGQGPVTDVVISNVIFMDSHRGVRMLSSDQRMDRVLISNATGTNRERFVTISHMSNPGLGNFGAITFHNVNVDPAPHPTWTELRGQNVEDLADGGSVISDENDKPMFVLNARIDSLQLHHITTRQIDGRPLIQVGPDAEVELLDASLNVDDREVTAVPVTVAGRIRRLKLSVNWTGTDPIKYAGGAIEHLSVSSD